MSDETKTSDPPRTPAPAGRTKLTGIALMCLAVACFTGIDTSAKWLAHTLPSIEIAFFRYLVAFLFAAAAFPPGRVPNAWRTRRPALQLLRGLCLLGSTVFNFLALRHLQLAETMTIAFSAPLVIALLSGPFLGETVGLRRWILIGLGFAGILVVVRPTAGGLHPAAIFAFLNVGCYAVYVIVTRKLAGIDSPASMLILSTGLPVLVLSPALPAIWVTPVGATSWGLLVVMGLCGTLGHLLLIHAFARAPASVLAPYGYTQIVWMVLSGLIVFGDLPTLHTVVGGAIVVTSGLVLLWFDRGEGTTPAR